MWRLDKPDQDAMCSFVNVRYQPDLVALLSITELIDTDSIYPNRSIFVLGAYSSKCSPEIVCDVKPLPVQGHGVRGIKRSPNVRDRLVEGENRERQL